MPNVQLTITPEGPVEREAIKIETPDVITALAVTDINLGTGAAELWDGDRRLARLSKLGNGQATFWQVT